MRKTFAALLCIALLASAALPAHAADPLTDGEILYSEDFSGSLDDLTAKEGVKLSVGSACEASVADGALMMKCAAAKAKDGDLFFDLQMEFPEAFVFSYRYMIERAADGEGSVACFILYPTDSVRVLTNGNSGGKLAVTDGAANANMSLAVETKSGVWYTLYTAVDSAAGTYSMYRQADGEMERTVIAENKQLQTKGSAPMVRIMTQRNSDAVAYVDDIVIRAYAPTTAAETTATSETTAAPAEESAPQTADTAVVTACAAAAAALGVCVSKRKKR